MHIQKFYASESIVYSLKTTVNNLRLALYSTFMLIFLAFISFALVKIPAVWFAVSRMPELRNMMDAIKGAVYSGAYRSIGAIVMNVHITTIPRSVIVASICAVIIVLILLSMLIAGYMRMLFKLHDTGSVNLKEMFMGWYLGPRLLIGGIIFSICVLIGLCLFIVPSIYILVRWKLFPYFIIDKHLGVIEAFKRSFNAVRGYGWQIGALILVSSILSINPVIALFTLFIQILMNIHAYRRLTA